MPTAKMHNIGAEPKGGGGTAEKAARAVFANWISSRGMPDILLMGEDFQFTGSEFSLFRNEQNIT